jgi:purine nucleoside phosphorylase
VTDFSRRIAPADHPARLDALVAAVRARSSLVPRVGIVLGSGLGGLATDLVDAVSIPFAELPGWPAATAPGHTGALLLGSLAGTPVVMLQGRFHLY